MYRNAQNEFAKGLRRLAPAKSNAGNQRDAVVQRVNWHIGESNDVVNTY
jgi:hypothetical protein